MIYAVTIFLSSFLLFLVQPLIARLILPWFGGSAAVWTTCMLFFQALLLAGYAYAHVLTTHVRGARRQAIVHTVLLAGALALLPIAPGESWKPAGDAEPISRILVLLVATVGLPYFLLASTSPLIQAWFARARPSANPYRLFALSNLASLIALLGYPFAVEPQLTGHQQVVMWSWLFALFALLCATVAWLTPEPAPQHAEAGLRGRMETRDVAYWLALSATGSVLLLAVTNHLTQNVAAVPLLWLLPLTLYLLSFIIAFEGKGWYRPEWFWSFVLIWLAGMAWLLVDSNYHYDLPVQLAIFLPGLLLACLFCHGELYLMRPAPQQLTGFYLIVSAGGALGGLLVAVVAPLVFSGYYELGAGLVVLAVLCALRFRSLNMVALGASLALVLAVAAAAVYDVQRDKQNVSIATRSFYGVLRVKEYGAEGEEGHIRRLIHGTIMHGEQYMHPEKRGKLTTYYAEKSGIGLAIESKHDKPVKVGVIGLGTGTLAAYGRPNDVFRFYDIDPRVIELAQSQFTYLGESKAKVELAVGDARLTLEREAPQNFDVLAVDAFSSDAIPVHLITKEALGIYLRHMKPDGIVAFHVSNRFLDLVPVVARLAREHGVHVTHIKDDPDDDDPLGRSRSDWLLVSRSAEALKKPGIVQGGAVEPKDRPEWRTWTDDYSNLIQILKQ